MFYPNIAHTLNTQRENIYTEMSVGDNDSSKIFAAHDIFKQFMYEVNFSGLSFLLYSNEMAQSENTESKSTIM